MLNRIANTTTRCASLTTCQGPMKGLKLQGPGRRRDPDIGTRSQALLSHGLQGEVAFDGLSYTT
jgi:hypothetical protein